MSIINYTKDQFVAQVQECMKTVCDDNFRNIYLKDVYRTALCTYIKYSTDIVPDEKLFVKKLRALIRKTDNLFETTGTTFLIKLIRMYFQGNTDYICIKTFLIECSDKESQIYPNTKYIDHVDDNGYTALMWAASDSPNEKSLKCVELLLQYGARTNICSRHIEKGFLRNALIIVANKLSNDNSIKVAKMLINYGANINYSVTYGMSDFFRTILFNKSHNNNGYGYSETVLEFIQFLVDKKIIFSNHYLFVFFYYSRSKTDMIKILSVLTNNTLNVSVDLHPTNILLEICKYINNSLLTNVLENVRDINKIVNYRYNIIILLYYYGLRANDSCFLKHNNIIYGYDCLLLDLFTLFKEPDYELIKHLIDNGMNVNLTDKNGTLFVAKIIHSMMILNISISDIKYALTFLINNGLNINRKNNENQTLIELLLLYLPQKYDIIELLIENGADVNNCNAQKQSLLHLIIVFESLTLTLEKTKIIKLLINKNIDVNIRSSDNLTPLFLMCALIIDDNDVNLINEALDCVKMLINKTTIDNICTPVGDVNILMQACVLSSNKYNFECVKLLVEKVKLGQIFNDYSYLQICIECLFDKEKRNPGCSIECIKYLLLKGVNPNDDSVHNKKLPLIKACEMAIFPQYMQCVELFLENGANINACDIDGKTPLHMVCCNLNRNSSIECLNYLINKGKNIDINALDGNLFTPLMYLCTSFRESRNNNYTPKISAKCFIDALEILLSINVDVNICTIYEEQTPLMIICDTDLNEFRDNHAAISVLIGLITASKESIENKDTNNETAYDIYMRNNNIIFDSNQLSFLKGASVFSRTKSSRK